MGTNASNLVDKKQTNKINATKQLKPLKNLKPETTPSPVRRTPAAVSSASQTETKSNSRRNDNEDVWKRNLSSKQYSLTEIEQLKEEIDWRWVSLYQTLTKEFIIKYKSRIHFEYLSKNKKLTPDVINEFIDDLDLSEVLKNVNEYFKFTPESILKLPSYKVDTILTKYRLDDDILNIIIDNYGFSCCCKNNISKCQTLSESFMTKHSNKLNWNHISRYQKLSLSFIEANSKLIRWDELSYNKNLTTDIVTKYRQQLKNTEEVENVLIKM